MAGMSKWENVAGMGLDWGGSGANGIRLGREVGGNGGKVVKKGTIKANGIRLGRNWERLGPEYG